MQSAPVTVTIAVSPQAATAALLIANNSSRTFNVRSLDGSTLSGGSSAYIFVRPDPAISVRRVVFTLDGRPFSIEPGAPYDFAGTTRGGAAYPFESNLLSLGSHVITATVVQRNGSTSVVTATFNVANTTPHSLVVSNSSDRRNPSSLSGAVLAGRRYIFLGPAADWIAGGRSVVFRLDGRVITTDVSVPDYLWARTRRFGDRARYTATPERVSPGLCGRATGRWLDGHLRRAVQGEQLTIMSRVGERRRRARRAGPERPRFVADHHRSERYSTTRERSRRGTNLRFCPCASVFELQPCFLGSVREQEGTRVQPCQRRRQYRDLAQTIECAPCPFRRCQCGVGIAGDHMDLDDPDQRVGDKVIGTERSESLESLGLHRQRTLTFPTPRRDAGQSARRPEHAVGVVGCFHHAAERGRAVARPSRFCAAASGARRDCCLRLPLRRRHRRVDTAWRWLRSRRRHRPRGTRSMR